MKKLIIAMVLVIALTMGAAVPAFAQGPGNCGRPTEADAITFVCDKASVAVSMLDPEECEAS